MAVAIAQSGDTVMPIARRWISPKDASSYLGLHIQTIYSLFYRGLIPGARVGRTVRIDLKALDAALEKKLEKK